MKREQVEAVDGKKPETLIQLRQFIEIKTELKHPVDKPVSFGYETVMHHDASEHR